MAEISNMDSIAETLEALEGLGDLNTVEKSGFASYSEGTPDAPQMFNDLDSALSINKAGLKDSILSGGGNAVVRNVSEMAAEAESFPFRFNAGMLEGGQKGLHIFSPTEINQHSAIMTDEVLSGRSQGRKIDYNKLYNQMEHTKIHIGQDTGSPGDIVNPKGKPEDEYTVIEDAGDDKVKVRDNRTGQEKLVDSKEMEMKQAIRIPIFAKEEPEKDSITEEKDVHKPEDEPLAPKVNVYEQFVHDVLSCPEVAPLVISKLLELVKNQPELMAKLEFLIPDEAVDPKKVNAGFWKEHGPKLSFAIWATIKKESSQTEVSRLVKHFGVEKTKKLINLIGIREAVKLLPI